MKIFACIKGLGLLLFLCGQPLLLFAQQTSGCNDVLYMRDGSRFRGQLIEIRSDDTVVFQLWSKHSILIPHKNVRRIVQRCKNKDADVLWPKPYTFRERGWYHHTRMASLSGQAYYGLNRTGFQLQHSSGFQLNRLIGLGLGTGIELFDPKGIDAMNYPIFGEIRGYLLARKITPYYVLAGGWAFAGKSTATDNWNNNKWKGGWMAQADFGYRIDNHLTIHFGLRLQRKIREWTSVWGAENGQGSDRILHKRLVIGLGLIL